jgi:excisionase family DNA binding protein
MRTWLNVSEAAEYAGVSRDTIYTACERRELRNCALERTPRDSDQTAVD